MESSEGSPPQPPDDDENPQHEEEKPHEPAPIAALSLRHFIHASEGTTEKGGSGGEGIVLAERSGKSKDQPILRAEVK